MTEHLNYQDIERMLEDSGIAQEIKDIVKVTHDPELVKKALLKIASEIVVIKADVEAPLICK